MRPAGHFEALELSFFRAHFVLLDCGHCYCAGGRLNIYYMFDIYLKVGPKYVQRLGPGNTPWVGVRLKSGQCSLGIAIQLASSVEPTNLGVKLKKSHINIFTISSMFITWCLTSSLFHWSNCVTSVFFGCFEISFKTRFGTHRSGIYPPGN